MDSSLVANEVVEDIRRKRDVGVIIKEDYEKTYDTLR